MEDYSTITNQKEDTPSGSNPGVQTDQVTSAGSVPADVFIESKKQNIHKLQSILDDLLAQYEGLKNRDDNDSSRRGLVLLREIRLLTRLLDSLTCSLMNPKNTTADDGLLTEEGASVFKECVQAFLISAARFIRQEVFAGDPDKAQTILDRLAAFFDESFGVFINTNTEEEN